VRVVGGAREDGDRQMLCAVERAERVRAEPGTVGSLMRRDVLCVRPNVDIDDIVLLFIERSVGGVPVVDDDGVPVGMISKTDLVAAYAPRRAQGAHLDSFDVDDVVAAPEPISAQDVMSKVVFTLREDDSIGRAAELFAAEHVHRAPVVGRDGQVVGVITSFDLVRALAGAVASP
jgi:CBS domain-containing protein